MMEMNTKVHCTALHYITQIDKSITSKSAALTVIALPLALALALALTLALVSLWWQVQHLERVRERFLHFLSLTLFFFHSVAATSMHTSLREVEFGALASGHHFNSASLTISIYFRRQIQVSFSVHLMTIVILSFDSAQTIRKTKI